MSIPLSPDQFEKKNKPIKTMPRRRVSLSKIFPTQVDSDPEKIKRMRQTDPDDFKTVPVVGKKDGMYFALDGHHRIARDIDEGRTTIDVRIVK